MIEWAVAATPMPGESRSGDLHLVKEFSRGTLLGAVDGLGHGDEAADVARAAVDTLEANADDDVVSLIGRCHDRLRGTRGAAITLLSILHDDLTLTSVAVGNVDAVRIRADGTGPEGRQSVVQRGGVVGFQLPRLQASTDRLAPGDVLILTTDGIRAGFARNLPPGEPTRRMADRILSEFGRTTDDALVLAARVRGGR